MAVLAWGKPQIFVQKLDDNGDPSGKIRKVVNPKEDSTQLETSEGDKSEAKSEGGSIVDVKRKKSTFSLKFDEFVKKGGKLTFGDFDGVVDGNYRMWYIPEDAACPGLYFPKGQIGVTTAATTADGITQSITFDAIEKDENTKQMMIGKILNLTESSTSWDVTKTTDFVAVESESDENEG